MQGLGNRDQGLGTGLGLGPFRGCGAEGCRGLAWPGQRFCERCSEELEALARMAALDDRRSATRSVAPAVRFRRLGRWVRRRLWWANAAVVGGALLYLGLSGGAALMSWLEVGGR